MNYLLLAVVLMLSACSGIEAKYQADMDKIRISHIDSIAALLREYSSKAGSMPLREEIKTQDIQVFITHRELPKWLIEQTEQRPIDSYTSQALEAEITRVLGREIQLPSDPQKVATYAPNVYIYHVNKNWACVAGHLYTATSKTKNVQNRYHKYETCLGAKS